MAKQEMQNQIEKMIAFSIIICLIIFFLYKCGGSSSPEPAAEYPKDSKEWLSRAEIISRNFVKERLKAPSTAEFPSSGYISKYSQKEDCYYVVSHVDAQNAFGAMLRQRWAVKVKYTGGDWAEQRNWQLLSFGME